MADLPDGEVTFLFTDIEGSTALWEEAPGAMIDALQLHDDEIDRATDANGGIAVKPRGEGDSRFIVFPSAVDAVAAAADIQNRLGNIDWPTSRPIRTRIAIHTGSAELQLGDYYGSTVNRAARLRAIAHGGQTVMSSATWELVRDRLPQGVRVTDMGDHRLKDLTRPEHVYQVDPEGLELEFPPLASLDAVPTNLPVQLTDFVGRESELEDLARIVGESRLVTILAPGGAGKTRLAIQVAANLASDFPDGVFLVDLAPVTVARDIPQAAAESMGLALTGEEEAAAQLSAHLANDVSLLVFDNAEHLPEAADLVARLLQEAPKVRVIATSRTKLAVTGETVFNLPGLQIDWDSPEEALMASGVRLFIDGAKRADAAFSLGTGDLDPLREILSHVSGLPLGILLAAAWVDALPVSEIAAEIARSMDFLETSARDLPERHRSVRAVFDYSWALLDESDRAVFAALSVFRGGFNRGAAEEVAGANVRGLANLVGKSLLVSSRESGRYSIHELLRQYAEEELRTDSAEWRRAVESHTAHFTSLVSSVSHSILNGRDQVGGLQALEDDLDNVRFALRRALEARDVDAVRNFVVGLSWLFEVRGWIKAALDLLAEVGDPLEVAEGEDAKVASGTALAYRAKLLTNLGHPAEAAVVAGEARDRLEMGSDWLGHVMALEALSEIAMYQGDYDEVRSLSEEVIRVAAEAGNELWPVAMNNYLGYVHMISGDTEAAMKVFHDTDRALERLGEMLMRTWTLDGMATLAMMQGRLEDAGELREKQLELARHIGYVRATALALVGLGSVHAAAGRAVEAERAYLDGLARFEQMGQAPDMAMILIHVARLRGEVGREGEAIEILSSVVADPAAEQTFVTEGESIGDLASVDLARFEDGVTDDDFSAAMRTGSGRSLDATVRMVLGSGTVL